MSYEEDTATSPADPVTLRIRWTDHASQNVNARIAELRRRDQRVAMDRVVEGIQFLRSVATLASYLLPTFYTFVGSSTEVPSGEPLWRATQAACLNFSSLQTISLICRSAFDEGSTRGLSAKRFATSSEATLQAIAEFWAKESGRGVEEASRALRLMRDLFRRCAHPKKSLLDAESLLERRIGLLKYYADRRGAHLTLDAYVFHLIDVIHVVASMTVTGAIIVGFDQARMGPNYFNSIDEAGWNAAKGTFPYLTMERLFKRFDIHAQANLYSKGPQYDGLGMLLTRLPAAIGYWDSRDESANRGC